MDDRKSETQVYIERRTRNALAINALKRIRKLVDRFEADDRKARIAVYIFALLFTMVAIFLVITISHTSR
jgi:hypothetical protein